MPETRATESEEVTPWKRSIIEEPATEEERAVAVGVGEPPMPAKIPKKKEDEKIKSEVEITTKDVMCIVHKGLIEGPIYLCPNCQTFYCLTCAYSLKAKGEKCWVCESEFRL